MHPGDPGEYVAAIEGGGLFLPCPRERTKNAGRHLCGLTLPINRAIIVERFEKTAAHGPVAQLGERRVRIAEAEGSNPFGSTKQKPQFQARNWGFSFV